MAISRVLCLPDGRCLSFICPTHCCAGIAFYPPAMDEQPLDAGIHELATHRWCGTLCHHSARWALTPPFHPYRTLTREDAAVIFCHLNPAVTRSFPLRNVTLCVARTFLSQPYVNERQAAILLLAGTKVQYFIIGCKLLGLLAAFLISMPLPVDN